MDVSPVRWSSAWTGRARTSTTSCSTTTVPFRRPSSRPMGSESPTRWFPRWTPSRATSCATRATRRPAGSSSIADRWRRGRSPSSRTSATSSPPDGRTPAAYAQRPRFQSLSRGSELGAVFVLEIIFALIYAKTCVWIAVYFYVIYSIEC